MPLATETEAMYEFASTVGYARRDRAGLLTDYDVWVANPAYAGPPQPHQESYEDALDGFDRHEAAMNPASVEPGFPRQSFHGFDDDEIPF